MRAFSPTTSRREKLAVWTTRITLLGKLRYRRRSWLCPHCHKSHQPLDRTLDLVVMYHGQSLEFVRELTLLCTLHAFEQGCTLFERCFDFEVSTHLAHRMVMSIGGKLHERLRSTGGRPSLGVTRRQKIPLGDADWELLLKIAKLLTDSEIHPTPGQVASELLRQRLQEVKDEIEHQGAERIRGQLAGAKSATS